MEGTENNKCLPAGAADMWMSQIDAQFSAAGSGGVVGGSVSSAAAAMRDAAARTMSSPPSSHLDLSRKQTQQQQGQQLYSQYDLPSVHYKQNTQGAMQFPPQPLSRSAWEFNVENFSTSKDYTAPQSLPQSVTAAGSRYSQSVHGYVLDHNVSQPPPDRRIPPSSISQPQRGGYLAETLPPQQSVGNFLPQSAQQALREQVSHSLPQQNARTDRSVWSHLYSLDPSIASYGMTSQTAQDSNFNQEKPYSYTLPRTTEVSGASTMALKMSSVPLEKPPLVLGKVSSAEQQLSASYFHRNSLPVDDVPISSLAPTVYSNVIGSATMTKPKASTSYEEEIGGYSPVSPPSHDASSPFSDLPIDQNTAALSLKNDSRYMMPSGMSDFSSSSKANPVNQFLHSDPVVTNSRVLPTFSHDVPLDMSKGWSSHNTSEHASPALVACGSEARSTPSVPQNSYSFNVSKERNNLFAPNQSRAPTNSDRITTNNSQDVFSGNQLKLNKPDTPSASSLSDLLSAPALFTANKSADTVSVNRFAVTKTTDVSSATQFAAHKTNAISSANQFTAASESTVSAQTVDQFSTNNSVDMRTVHPFSAINKPAVTSGENPQTASNESSDSTAAAQSNFSQKIAQTAPKKSNFYGRDASFFSVPEVSDQLSDVSPRVGMVKNTIAPSKEIPVSNTNATLDPLSAQTESCSELTGNTEGKAFICDDESMIASNVEASGTSFADSFIDATMEPSPNADDKLFVEKSMGDENKGTSVNSLSVAMDKNKEEVSGGVVAAVKSEVCADNIDDHKPETANPVVASETEPFSRLGEDPAEMFEAPITTFATTRGGKAGKAPRGRKRRGGATQRRQTKRGGKKAAGIVAAPVILEPDASGLGNVGMEVDEADGAVAMATVPAIMTPPAPKPRARRGKKPATVVEADNPPDSEGSVTRRSSSRRSKDNAMRLIELQAESIYGHVAKPAAEEEEEPAPPLPPAKPRRKAAKAAVKSSTFSDTRGDEEDLMGEKDISSDEMSDGKDADYAVDQEDVEAMEKDELLDLTKDQKKSVPEKKVGGLKISIKLGVDSSAEIVSGLDKSPPRKKRKVVKKKVTSQKFKSKAVIQDDDEDGVDSMDMGKGAESEKIKSSDLSGPELKVKGKDNEKVVAPNEMEEKGDVVDKHNSLMDKYFSSATQARPVLKPVKKGGGNLSKKQDGPAPKSKVSKTAKGNASKTISVPSSHSNSDAGINTPAADASTSHSDPAVPKFVCGYCPNRYHNKQELLSHMEAHMAEMEDKPNKTPDGDSASNVSKESKKSPTLPSSKKSDSGKSAVSKVPSKKIEVSEPLKYNCGECGNSFSSKPNLLDHVRSHAAEKPFECNLCHKFFKERDQLSLHRKIHVQEGLMRCQFCQKGFVNNADLAAHMETHPKRTKPTAGLHPNKQSVPNSVIKTTNLASDSSARKNSNHVSDSSLKKKASKLQQNSRDNIKDAIVLKPKSFASALEPSLEKVKDNPTLLLRRNEGSASSSKEESVKTSKSSKPLPNSSKPVKEEVAKKSSSSSKVGDVKKDSKDTSSTVRKEAKDMSSDSRKEPKPESKAVDQKPKASSEISVPPSVNKEEKDNSSAGGECTCQECPECVTRFLNSFE